MATSLRICLAIAPWKTVSECPQAYKNRAPRNRQHEPRTWVPPIDHGQKGQPHRKEGNPEEPCSDSLDKRGVWRPSPKEGVNRSPVNHRIWPHYVPLLCVDFIDELLRILVRRLMPHIVTLPVVAEGRYLQVSQHASSVRQTL